MKSILKLVMFVFHLLALSSTEAGKNSGGYRPQYWSNPGGRYYPYYPNYQFNQWQWYRKWRRSIISRR